MTPTTRQVMEVTNDRDGRDRTPVDRVVDDFEYGSTRRAQFWSALALVGAALAVWVAVRDYGTGAALVTTGVFILGAGFGRANPEKRVHETIDDTSGGEDA